MQKKVIVLGSGLVGLTIALDLATDDRIDVTVADANAASLERVKSKSAKATTLTCDLSNVDKLKEIIKPFDLVVGALPSFLGFQTLRAVIESGKNYVDISFMAEDFFSLSQTAEMMKTTAIVDIGVAPGLSHIFSVHGVNQLSTASKVVIYVGGNPVDPSVNTYHYKASWAPADVFLEFTRDSFIREDYKLVKYPGISKVEEIQLPNVKGPMIAFLSDGLRSLHKHLSQVPNLEEKTLRWPGHIEIMRALLEAGFLSEKEVTVKGVPIKPIDLAEKLILPVWKLDTSKDVEFTVMRVICEGKTQDGTPKKVIYDLYDQTDTKTSFSSMSRCTGFTCAIAARMLLFEDLGDHKGVFSPELIGNSPKLCEYLFNELAKRGVTFKQFTE